MTRVKHFPPIRCSRKQRIPNSRDKLPPSHLVGDLLRAILGDTPYPVSLLTQTELRIHAEHSVSRGKAAILKAWLLKNGSNPQYKEVIDVQLNEQTNYAPYVLGRLFAVLESLQQKANPGINATIMDRYFNAAWRNAQHRFPDAAEAGAESPEET